VLNSFLHLAALQCQPEAQLPLTRIVWKLVQSPAVVFVVALTIRLWTASQLLPGKAWSHFYQYNEFARIAWAVASGYGYSSPWANTPLVATAVEPPVYSYLLAGIFRIAGAYSDRSLWIATCLNATLSAITAMVILRIGKRDFGASVGVLAAWVWSCWLYEAAVALRLWENSLATLLLTVALLVLPGLASSRRTLSWCLFGALAGVAGLTNTTLLAVIPLFWVWLWVACKRRGQVCGQRLLASVSIFVLILVPWTIRNYTVFHRLLSVRDNFGLELWLGNHEGVSHRFDSDFPILDPTEYNRLGEIRFMEEKRQIALTFIGRNPAEFFRLSANRIVRYWTSPEPALWLPLTCLAWTGLVLALHRNGLQAVPYAIVLAMFPLVYYVTHTFSSYRHPTEPVMFILAAFAVVGIAEERQGKFFRGAATDSSGR
jgi:Dolichyl-phosphate-mannose-protein mannosyltransferase